MSDALTITTTNENRKERLIETWQLYLIITISSVLLSFAFQKFIMTREVYYTLYGSQLEDYRIDETINFIQKFQIWGYVATPLIVWLRIAFVAFLIQLPLILKFDEIPFREIFRTASFAFLVIISLDMMRFFYLYFLPPQSITAETLTFIPLSITNLLNKENYSALAISVLSKINLFELVWGYVIYRGLYKTGKLEKIDAALIVFGVWIGIMVLSVALVFFMGVLK